MYMLDCVYMVRIRIDEYRYTVFYKYILPFFSPIMAKG